MNKPKQGWLTINALTEVAIDYFNKGKLSMVFENLCMIKDILNELAPMEDSKMDRNIKIYSNAKR